MGQSSRLPGVVFWPLWRHGRRMPGVPSLPPVPLRCTASHRHYREGFDKPRDRPRLPPGVCQQRLGAGFATQGDARQPVARGNEWHGRDGVRTRARQCAPRDHHVCVAW